MTRTLVRGALGLATLVALTVPASALPPPPSPDPPASAVAVGAWDWPLPGVGDAPAARGGEPGSVTRRFLAPAHPFGRGHRGADLAAPTGTTVLAAGPGTVVFAGSLAGRGVVAVEHGDGWRTTYEPVAASVVPGAAVVRGAPLGTLDAGHRGCPVPACLHWGLRRPAPPGAVHPVQYRDPLSLLGLGAVRLLPRAR